MKRLLIILGLGLTIGMTKVNTVEAQVVNVYVNIDLQPAWGPAGYNYAAFYYFPALNIYYDVNNALFYYLSGRRWLSSYFLPVRFQRYDFYTMYKVVINDFHNPWLYNRAHRRSYAGYRNVRTQMPIRSMTADRRYTVARTNTRAWVEQRPAPNTSRSNRSTVTRATPNTQNRNVAPTQNRNTSTTTQNRNATTTQNRNAATTSQNRNATTTTQNRNAATPPRQENQNNRNSAGSSATQTRDRNQNNSPAVNSQNTTTRSNQNATTTRSSRSEQTDTSVNSNSNRQNNTTNSSATQSSRSTRSGRTGE